MCGPTMGKICTKYSACHAREKEKAKRYESDDEFIVSAKGPLSRGKWFCIGSCREVLRLPRILTPRPIR